MAGRRTHYEMLGVDRDASSVDIASAFRDKLEGRYRVAGRRVQYQGASGATFGFDIDSISSERMVQVVGEGQRLACKRRG